MTEKKIPKSKPKASKKIKSKKATQGCTGQPELPISNGNPFPPGFSFPEIQPPDGFRKLSASQALIEFGRPLFEMVPQPNSASKANEVFGVIPEIWNFAIDEQVATLGRKTEKQIITLISRKLGWPQGKARDFFSMMVERKRFLFPEEAQPKGTPYVFMRKEVTYLITRFDYERLNLSPEIIPANGLDSKAVKNLQKLDQSIECSEDYDKLEKLFLDVELGLLKRFSRWLVQKEVGEYTDQYCFTVGTYVDFIYGYEHQPLLTLRAEPGKYLVEFMIDFLLRKTSMEPWEYTLAPTALRLLYTFLYEKGYLDEPPTLMIGFIDIIDGHFIEYLKEQF